MIENSKSKEKVDFWKARFLWTQANFLLDREKAERLGMARLSLSREEFRGYTFITKIGAEFFYDIGEVLEKLGTLPETMKKWTCKWK
tara:strand:+ start:659 stop:919 length:261 start_codon:yes stop_codon:yes gene_type:complete